MTREQVLNKVRKLLRMTTERGCTEAEARQAAAMAQRLLIAHRLDQAALDVTDREMPQDPQVWADPLDASCRTRVSPWRSRLAGAVARANGCAVYYSGGQIRIVGTPDNVTATRYIYDFCAREIDRLAKQYSGNGRTWLASWRVGAATGVTEVLREARDNARQEAASAGVALLVIDNALATIDADRRRATDHMENSMRLVWRRRASGVRNTGARDQGIKDGRTINVTGAGNRAIGSGARLLNK